MSPVTIGGVIASVCLKFFDTVAIGGAIVFHKRILILYKVTSFPLSLQIYKCCMQISRIDTWCLHPEQQLFAGVRVQSAWWRLVIRGFGIPLKGMTDDPNQQPQNWPRRAVQYSTLQDEKCHWKDIWCTESPFQVHANIVSSWNTCTLFSSSYLTN